MQALRADLIQTGTAGRRSAESRCMAGRRISDRTLAQCMAAIAGCRSAGRCSELQAIYSVGISVNVGDDG